MYLKLVEGKKTPLYVHKCYLFFILRVELKKFKCNNKNDSRNLSNDDDNNSEKNIETTKK